MAKITIPYAVADFVNLRERRLDEGGCTAEQCGYPHPEQRTGASGGESGNDTDKISHTDAGRS